MYFMGARSQLKSVAAIVGRLVTSGVLLVCLLSRSAVSRGAERFEFHEPHLGTIVDLTLYAPNESVANESARAAFFRIKELNRILSDYEPDSEIRRLCRTAGTETAVPVSKELLEVLSKSIEISRLTDGAFDVSIGPVVKLWRTARRQRTLPADDQLAAARAVVGWKHIHLDPKAGTVELSKKGMLIDFGGIAKGYIADQARAVLFQRGIRQCLVAVAGDIAAGDPPPGRDCWRIGVAPLDNPAGQPSRYIRLANNSISTSGDAFQFVEIGGVRYSHIVDPATGRGLTRRSSVTVVAPQGVSADGLATAISILGPERGPQLLKQIRGAAALVVTATDSGVVVTESPGLAAFIIGADDSAGQSPERRKP